MAIYSIKSKRSILWCRLLGKFWPAFLTDFYTTWRFPFRRAVIGTPVGGWHDLGIIEHEMFHVEQFAPWYGPIWMLLLATLLPLPLFFSGRWFIERRAFLGDIIRGKYSVDDAVYVLDRFYLKPWPKKWMRSWFVRRLEEI